MGKKFEMMQPGDELQLHHINAIHRELNRLRSMRAVPPLRLIGMEDGVSNPEFSMGNVRPITMKLTATGDANGKHEWKSVLWNGTAYVDTGKVGNTNGDWAIEVNGLRCPKSDHVYRAWKNNWGVWTFEAVRTFGVTNTAINANTSGTVFLWSLFNGSLTNSNTSITAYNWMANTAVAINSRVMLTAYCGRWWVDVEDCAP